MSILEELWNGTICPIAQDNYRTGEYRDFVKFYERNEGKLVPALNAAQKDELEKMQECAQGMRSIAECSAFVTGFRLAVQFMTASFL